MSFAYSINGFRFDGRTITDGLWLMDGTEYAPALSPRRAVVEIPRVHYALPLWDDPLSEITISMTVRLRAGTPEQLSAHWDTLTGLLGMGSNRPLLLERHRGARTESCEAQLVSTTSPDFNCPEDWAQVQIILSTPGGAWRGPVEDQDFAPGAAQVLETAELSTRPMADCVLRLAGPATGVRVMDDLSQTGISWGGGSLVVADGSWLFIDCATMQAEIRDDPDFDGAGGISASGTLAMIGYGVFAPVTRRVGADALPEGAIDVEIDGGTGPLTIRSRYAVV